MWKSEGFQQLFRLFGKPQTQNVDAYKGEYSPDSAKERRVMFPRLPGRKERNFVGKVEIISFWRDFHRGIFPIGSENFGKKAQRGSRYDFPAAGNTERNPLTSGGHPCREK